MDRLANYFVAILLTTTVSSLLFFFTYTGIDNGGIPWRGFIIAVLTLNAIVLWAMHGSDKGSQNISVFGKDILNVGRGSGKKVFLLFFIAILALWFFVSQ